MTFSIPINEPSRFCVGLIRFSGCPTARGTHVSNSIKSSPFRRIITIRFGWRQIWAREALEMAHSHRQPPSGPASSGECCDGSGQKKAEKAWNRSKYFHFFFLQRNAELGERPNGFHRRVRSIAKPRAVVVYSGRLDI